MILMGLGRMALPGQQQGGCLQYDGNGVCVAMTDVLLPNPSGGASSTGSGYTSSTIFGSLLRPPKGPSPTVFRPVNPRPRPLPLPMPPSPPTNFPGGGGEGSQPPPPGLPGQNTQPGVTISPVDAVYNDQPFYKGLSPVKIGLIVLGVIGLAAGAATLVRR